MTTLIGKYHEEFDTDFWSSYKALEALVGVEKFGATVKRLLLDKKKFNPAYPDMLGVDEEEFQLMKTQLIEKYERANREACDRGSIYHRQQEDSLYGKPQASIEELGFKLPELEGRKYTVIRDDCDMNKPHDIKSEFLLYWSCEDSILNLAGQADVIVKDGNDIYILDHKTNAKGIETHSYFDRKKKSSVRMFHPVNHLEDCNLVHYTLQLSFYAWMLQKLNPEFNIKLLRILHVDGEGNQTDYDLEYRKDDIEHMLKNYKTKLVEQYFRKYGKMPELKSLARNVLK